MEQARQTNTPYDLVGGMPVVEKIVNRFYDLLENPVYAELRALHAPDLAPMRTSLSGFLAAWLGGPRDWFSDNPGKCMMSAHRDVTMNTEVGQQWAEAMACAIADSPVEPELGAKMADALGDLARSMARRD
jgi:hemoglobin